MSEEKQNKNLELWNKVEKTDPKYTKPAKVGGMNITAISPQYQIMMVTEQFGTYGETWGFKDIELSYDLVEAYNMVVFKGTFFFPKGQFEIINSAKLYMDRKLTMLDDNFAKKIETDTLTKAISKLGFNADIFMGKFDDIRYVEEMQEEFHPTPPVEKVDLNKASAIGNAKLQTTLDKLKETFNIDEDQESKYKDLLIKYAPDGND